MTGHTRGTRGARSDRKFWAGMARAAGGAIFFALPLLMTMEMWWLGFYMDRVRLALFMVVMVPILVALDHYSGFKATSSWREDFIDGIVAYGVGFAAAAAVLALLDIIEPSMSWEEIVGKIAVQAVPASFGAVLAVSQFGGAGEERSELREHERRLETAHYPGELFFMLAGAVFLAFNVAPTEEMAVIAFRMSYGQAAMLAVASIVMMHGFVFAAEFRGAPAAPEGATGWSLFLRFTMVGYLIALLMSAYVLWTFGRFDTASWSEIVHMCIVLGFPASLGGAAARLIL